MTLINRQSARRAPLKNSWNAAKLYLDDFKGRANCGPERAEGVVATQV